MKKVFQLIATTCFAVAILLTTSTAFAQQRTSPRDSVMAKIAGANIKINYGSPAVDGRAVWGGLVPYDKMWRAGANQATTFTTDKEIIKDLWEPILKAWFTEGIDDPRITAIKVEAKNGYYWDNKHGNTVAFAKTIVGAVLGKTLDDSIEGSLINP